MPESPSLFKTEYGRTYAKVLGRARLGLVGRALVAVAVASWLAGLGVLVTELVNDDSDAGANLGVASVCLAAGASVLGFLLRRRVRRAQDAMVLGLAALGGWFLLIVYALGRDTP